ncbi:MAG TPA: ECF-type sigma factor [Lacipirellulaceae bacterium]|nr:ECF-type sigma factor [Lacipirellulaceae bacterium]
MASDSFHDLIRQVRAGDQNAAAGLVRLYESAIRRAVRFRLHDARLRSQFDSMDICQSVLASFFVRAAAGQYDIETPEQLVKLLTTMARNKLASQARKEFARNRAVCQSADPSAANEPWSTEPDPSDESSARELCREALMRLNAEERELVELRQRGCDWDSIAREKNSTPVVLRKRLSRALDRVLHEVGLE